MSATVEYLFSPLRRVTTCGVGSSRRSGRWWSATPWWFWSPSTCTSSEVCLGCSDRSWACQRKGEFLCIRPYWFLFSFAEESFVQKWIVFDHYTCLNCQSSWPGFGTVRHSGAICTYPSSCCVPIGLYSPAALLQLRLSDPHWPRQCTCQTGFQVRWQEYQKAAKEYPTIHIKLFLLYVVKYNWWTVVPFYSWMLK